ncbi:MAG TPA: efflux RND transporter permease subunit [Burkholderiaceae bacterium]|nr:efflux RND transporter permease subunit [Burkholderiaceae bacterium]
MVNYFIDRPIFSWVIAIVIMLAGALAIPSLPIAQYPAIAPTQITVSVSYPGASAETVQSTMVQVIEQQLSGLDHLRYFTSSSNKDGSMEIALTFEQGTNADIAQVQVQNKLALATPQLPPEVQQQGIRVVKGSQNYLLIVGFVSTDGSMDRQAIGDFLVSSVQDPLSRTPGVGDYTVFGSQYAMRVWLDPSKLDSYALTPGDVSNALRAQNVQISSGEIGGLPAVAGQQLNASVIGPTRLKTMDEFEQVLLRVNRDGSQVRLGDVARVELGSEFQGVDSRYNGKPAAGIGIKLASGANALDTANAVRATLDKLRPQFPTGLEVVYPYDTTPFVRLSIEEVVKTLFEAIVLVFLVMFLFLQNFRATLIPTLAVPVVLLGTFAVLAASGYTINTLTMFGMVLAIGLLVDDAIVVVENVERVMAEEGLSPKEATRKSMGQISGALVGVAMVLSAVFLPMAFFGGSAGIIYRQFSITIVSAMTLSVIVALVFTPSLCATLLKPIQKGHHEQKRGFFGWFNRVFDAGAHRYASGVQHLVGRTGRYILVYAVIVAAVGLLFMRIPAGFLPDEDLGVIAVEVRTPPGAAIVRTNEAMAQVRKYLLNDEKESVSSVYEVAGFSFSGRGQNTGVLYINLKDWDERRDEQHHAQAIAQRTMAHFAGYKDAMVFAFPPPAIIELGNATGFDAQLQDRAGKGHAALMEARNQLLGAAAHNPALVAVRPNGRDDEPQYRIDIDWEKASAFGLSVADVNNTLSTAWGSSYVNQFIDRGRVKRVYVQGDAPYRMRPEDFANWYVRNASGTTVPFSAFATGHWTNGPPKLDRYNGTSSAEILGQPAPGYSTGQAMQEVERLVDQLPPGFGIEWTGLSYEERQSGGQAPMLYALSIAVVFLSLAALYESWSIPFSVLLVVPLGVLGTVLGALLRGLNNDVYFQVALLTTVGLAAKNAILIVEFAKENVEHGMGLIESAVHAARQRLRPILMTSLAFILGVMPLALSSGAGSGSQNAVGTGIVTGTLAATVLGIFFIPLFFVAVRSLLTRRQPVLLTPSTSEAQ